MQETITVTTRMFRFAQSHGVQTAPFGMQIAISHFCKLAKAHENKRGFLTKESEDFTVALFVKQLSIRHLDEPMAAAKEVLEKALQNSAADLATVLEEVSIKCLCGKLAAAYTENPRGYFIPREEAEIIFSAILLAGKELVDAKKLVA